MPGDLLLAAPRPDPGRDGARRGPRRRRRVGRADGRARPGYRWVQVFENRGESHGRLEPASARPDLGRHRAAARGGQARTRRSAATCEQTGDRLLLDYAAPGAGRPAGGRGERRLAGRRPVLGDLAVRDARPPAPRRRSGCPGLDDRQRDALATSLIRLARSLRRPVRAAVPVLDGLAPGAVRPTAGRRDGATTGSSTPTSIRRCCGRRSASSWSATSCSPRRSVT